MTTPWVKVILFLSVLLALNGCSSMDSKSSNSIKHMMYKMTDDIGCLNEMGYTNCHSDGLEYQQYKTQRDAIKRGE